MEAERKTSGKGPPRNFFTIVYKEIQKYLFIIDPVELSEGTGLLTGIVGLFEDGAAEGKSVLEVTGNDVAAFCDDLIELFNKTGKPSDCFP